MVKIFDDSQTYPQEHPKVVALLGSPQTQAQKRYHNRSLPPWIKVGRKTIYAGEDLNAWIDANRTYRSEYHTA